jgi:hypothetical protein
MIAARLLHKSALLRELLPQGSQPRSPAVDREAAGRAFGGVGSRRHRRDDIQAGLSRAAQPIAHWDRLARASHPTVHRLGGQAADLSPLIRAAPKRQTTG